MTSKQMITRLAYLREMLDRTAHETNENYAAGGYRELAAMQAQFDLELKLEIVHTLRLIANQADL